MFRRNLLARVFAIGIALIPLAVFGQAALLPNAEQQYFDNNGKPLASGQVTYYVPGTSHLARLHHRKRLNSAGYSNATSGRLKSLKLRNVWPNWKG